MGIALIIVIGVVVVSVVGVLGDMVTKTAQAKARSREALASSPSGEIEALKNRLASLESRVDEKDESVRKLQEELGFVSRMLEDRTEGRPGG